MFRTLAFLCFPLVSVCVHTPGRYNTSAGAELAELRKITKFQGKNTIFNEHPVAQCVLELYLPPVPSYPSVCRLVSWSICHLHVNIPIGALLVNLNIYIYENLRQ